MNGKHVLYKDLRKVTKYKTETQIKNNNQNSHFTPKKETESNKSQVVLIKTHDNRYINLEESNLLTLLIKLRTYINLSFFPEEQLLWPMPLQEGQIYVDENTLNPYIKINGQPAKTEINLKRVRKLNNKKKK